MFKASLTPLPWPLSKKALKGEQSASPLPPLAFQLREYVMTQVPQGCCSVSDNPGRALVPLGAAEGKKFMSLLLPDPIHLLILNPYP